jgi:hypothetical protein
MLEGCDKAFSPAALAAEKVGLLKTGVTVCLKKNDENVFWNRLHLSYDHVVLLVALIKLDYNLTSTSWHSSSGLRGHRRTYRTIFYGQTMPFLEWLPVSNEFEILSPALDLLTRVMTEGTFSLVLEQTCLQKPCPS